MTDDPKWLQWRSEGITATDVADAAAGTYGGLYGVVARKRGLITTEVTPQMERGLRWEQPIADAVHILTGLYVVGEQTWCQHRDDERLRATIDGFLSPKAEATLDDCTAVLETKTVGVDVRPNRDRWRAQMQWQMLVTGIDLALLVEARIDDSDDTCGGLRLEWLEADEFVQYDLIELAEEMWGHVQAGTLPEPKDPSALVEVRKVYAVADPDADVVLLEDLADELARRVLLKAYLKDAEDQLAVIDARIIEAMGSATKGVGGGYRVTYSQPARKLTAEREAELLDAHPEFGMTVLDRARLKREAKELYESFQTRAGARSLTITPPKES